MNQNEIESELIAIGERVRERLNLVNITRVSFSVVRSQLRLGVGGGVDSFSFVVQSNPRNWTRFEAWDWDNRQRVTSSGVSLENRPPQQLADLLCGYVRKQLKVARE